MRYDPETISGMAAMWNKGYSASQIAAQYDTSRGAVIGVAFRNRDQFQAKVDTSKIVRSKRLAPRSAPVHTTTHMFQDEAIIAKVEDLWKRGRTIRDIGDIIEISKTTVAKIIAANPGRFAKRDAGVAFRAPSPARLSPEAMAYDESRRALAVELWRLEPGQCKWGLNEGGPYIFCAAEAEDHRYCNHHLGRAFARYTA